MASMFRSSRMARSLYFSASAAPTETQNIRQRVTSPCASFPP